MFLLSADIALIVPEGAINRNQTEEVFIAALREDKDKPVLLGKNTTTILSFIPTGTTEVALILLDNIITDTICPENYIHLLRNLSRRYDI